MTPVMTFRLDIDNAWPDLLEIAREGKLIHYKGTIDVAALPKGMESGRASVAFRFDLPGGSVLIAETSLRLFITAARAFIAKYGEPE